MNSKWAQRINRWTVGVPAVRTHILGLSYCPMPRNSVPEIVLINGAKTVASIFASNRHTIKWMSTLSCLISSRRQSEAIYTYTCTGGTERPAKQSTLYVFVIVVREIPLHYQQSMDLYLLCVCSKSKHDFPMDPSFGLEQIENEKEKTPSLSSFLLLASSRLIFVFDVLRLSFTWNGLTLGYYVLYL